MNSVEGPDAYAIEVEAIEERDNSTRSVAMFMTPDEADIAGDRFKELAKHARSENKRIAAYRADEADIKKALAVKRCPDGLDPEKCGACANLLGYDHTSDRSAVVVRRAKEIRIPFSVLESIIERHNRS